MNISKAKNKEGGVTNIQRLKLNEWEYKLGLKVREWWFSLDLADCLVELLQGGADHSFKVEVVPVKYSSWKDYLYPEGY